MAPAQMVVCPICNKNVPEKNINHHLDSQCNDSLVPAAPGSADASVTATLTQSKSSKAVSGSQKLIHPIFQPQTHKEPKNTHSISMSKKRPNPPTPGNLNPLPAKRNKISANLEQASPLAERLRPSSLSEFVGQKHISDPDGLFMACFASRSTGLILWGPPGCGKTTLARLIAKQTGSIFKELSATVVGINDVRSVFDEAKQTLSLSGRRTILFLDEIHRFNRAQQDIFLPYVEQGHIQLVGATTENPSFKLNGALLSRCRVFVLERLSDTEIDTIIRNAILRVSSKEKEAQSVGTDPSSQGNPTPPSTPSTSQPIGASGSHAHFPCYPHITQRVVSSIVSLSAGDARTALSLLELTLLAPRSVSEQDLMESLRRSVSTSYDRTGDSRYDMISALHKSVRGSDADAALYWLARMLVSGEDPLYIARRMVVCASEDIGLADRHALPLAMAALQACQTIGMPECRINLAHIVTYLSEASKSTRAYEAYSRAELAAKADLTLPVPLQVRNAPTKLMEELGYSEGYRYNPDYAHPVHNSYVPPEIEGQIFLRKEDDLSGKKWDEEALKQWEGVHNNGLSWEGRGQRP